MSENISSHLEKPPLKDGVAEKNSSPEVSYVEKTEESTEIQLPHVAVTSAPVIEQKDKNDADIEVKKIESVLEEGMKEIYISLPEEKKKEFKSKGESVARQINAILHATKKKIGEIISLIISWLKIIPGVSRFFVEQQAVLKAQKLLNNNNKKK